MKKTTALLLSLLMVVSLFTCLGMAPASAEGTIPSVIIQDFEGITYLDSGTQRNPDGAGAINSHGELKTDAGNSYLQIPNTAKWVRYLNNNKENSVLDDSATYHVSFKYRVHNDGYSNASGKYACVYFWWHTKNGSTPDNNTNEGESPVNAKNGVRLRYNSDEETWRTATIYNLPLAKDAGDKYIQLQILGQTDATDVTPQRLKIDLDDFVFTKAATPVAKVENNGTDYVSVNTTKPLYGETVTYTATEKAENTFIGWYNEKGEEVSKEKTYSFKYDGTQELTYTAKFTAIVQDFESGEFKQETATKVVHDPDNTESIYINMWDTTMKSDDTTYVNISGLKSGRAVHFVTNKKETGLLSAGKTYNISFRYRVHKGTATETNPVKFAFWKVDGTNKGTSQQSLSYLSDETTWRIATIKNYTLGADEDGYYRMRIEGIDGMSIDIDDIAFVEAKTGSVDHEGNGNATVNTTNPAFGETVTYTATEKSANNFYGWFDDNGNVASTEDELSFTYTGKQNLTYKAKFLNSVKQDFENIDEYITGAVRDPDGVSSVARYTAGTLKREENNNYIEITNDNKWIQFLTNDKETGRLDINKTYNLTFRYRIHEGAVSTQPVKIYFCKWDGTPDFSQLCASGGTGFGVSVYYDAEYEGQWRTAVINNLQRNDEDGRVRINVNQTGGHNTATIDLDDFVFTEVIDDTTEVAKGFEAKNMGFNGTAMRAESADKKQAMRFKHTIERGELDANGYLGYDLVEYGFVVASYDKLNGQELTLETDVAKKTGVAYKKGETDIRFADLGNGKIQFTAAVSGIGVQNYGDKLTLRVYIKLKNGNTTVTLYSTPQHYSVYDVMWAVELKGTEAEKQVVDNICATDTAIATGFAEYKQNNVVE